MRTNLNEVLRQKQITPYLVLAGAVTSICIDSTGRAAHEQGYQVSMLSDCTSARTVFEQEFYFENVFRIFFMATLTTTNWQAASQKPLVLFLPIAWKAIPNEPYQAI